MRTRFTLWAVLVSCVFFVSGCSSTTLKTSNKNSQFSGKVNKVYIIGFANKQDTRQQFEDSFAENLMSYGVTGVSSYPAQPVLKEINDETVEKSIEAEGADALLLTLATGQDTISAADIAKPEAYRYELFIQNQSYGTYPQPYYKRYGTYDHVPQDYKPYGFYQKSAFSDFYSFSNPTRQIVYTPPNEYETIIITTYLFDAQTKELIWSAELETKDSGQKDKSINDFINTVTNDLRKQGVI
jgi:hypothetical protein